MEPYAKVVHSRVDSNTFIMGNPIPELNLSPSQGLWAIVFPAYSKVSAEQIRKFLSEVGKMKIVYLLPLSLPSTRHIGDIAYLKKGQDRAVTAYNLRPLEKSRYGARCFFTLKRSLEIVIDSNRQTSG
jgi:hypothetical protein